MTKIQNIKLCGLTPFCGHTEKLNVLDIGYLNLEFICYLVIVIWCFRTWCFALLFFLIPGYPILQIRNNKIQPQPQ